MTSKPTGHPTVEAFFDEPTFTVTYLVIDPATKHAAVIDSVLDFDQKAGRTGTKRANELLARIAATGVHVKWLLETHVHADHLSAAPYLKAKLGAPVVIGEHVATVQQTFKPVFDATDVSGDGREFDRMVRDGETLPLGELDIEVIHTPGHTPACLTYRIGDAAFVGDTMFMPDYGTARCDFPGGSARTLYQSIRRILALPPETRLFMCHDYKAPGRDAFVWETTVAEQRAKNIHIHDGVSEAQFVAMREARDKTLAMPVLILPSVQVNMRAGHMPPPDHDGKVRLRLPVDML